MTGKRYSQKNIARMEHVPSLELVGGFRQTNKTDTWHQWTESAR